MIVLNMLAEQGLAEPTANGFHIASEDVSGMDSEQADILSLPKRLKVIFNPRSVGALGTVALEFQFLHRCLMGLFLLVEKALFYTLPALKITC